MTPKQIILLAVTLLILSLFLLTQCQGNRADKWKAKAQDAQQAATQQEQRAETAETSHQVSIETRVRMDEARAGMQTAEESAQRIENHAPNPIDPDAVPDDVLRELEDAHQAYSASAGRLQRKNTR